MRVTKKSVSAICALCFVFVILMLSGCSNERNSDLEPSVQSMPNDDFSMALRNLAGYHLNVTRGEMTDTASVREFVEQLAETFRNIVENYDIMADLTQKEVEAMIVSKADFDQMALDEDLFWNYIDGCKTESYHNMLADAMSGKAITINEVICNDKLKMNEKVGLALHIAVQEYVAVETPIDDNPVDDTPGDTPLMAVYTEKECKDMYLSDFKDCCVVYENATQEAYKAVNNGQYEAAETIILQASESHIECCNTAKNKFAKCMKYSVKEV